MKTRKKLRDTKIGIWLKEKAPDILDTVGDLLPDKGALGIVKNLISKDESLSPEDKEHALELLKLDVEFEKEISARWVSDMSSDSWLSKNIRPIILAYSWFLITLITVLSSFGIDLPSAYVTMIEALCISVNLAYFGSRGVEKYQSIRKK